MNPAIGWSAQHNSTGLGEISAHFCSCQDLPSPIPTIVKNSMISRPAVIGRSKRKLWSRAHLEHLLVTTQYSLLDLRWHPGKMKFATLIILSRAVGREKKGGPLWEPPLKRRVEVVWGNLFILYCCKAKSAFIGSENKSAVKQFRLSHINPAAV